MWALHSINQVNNVSCVDREAPGEESLDNVMRIGAENSLLGYPSHPADSCYGHEYQRGYVNGVGSEDIRTIREGTHCYITERGTSLVST